MRKVLFVITPVLLAFLALESSGQTPSDVKPAPPSNEVAASPCPKLLVQSLTPTNVREGGSVTFVATIAGGDPNVTPTIVWNISAGSIKNGQGTRRIDVDSTGAGVYRQIVADLWIGGYAPECSYQATASVKVIGSANKVDEFGDLPSEKESERVASVAASLSQSNDNLYVIAYAGRANVRGFANTALRRLRAQFIVSGVLAIRIASIDGGFREQPAYELWIVPEGAEPPRPTPTVDRREIVYPKITPLKRP